MYLVAIAWLYVAIMMSLAEAFSSTGSILGAVITFVLYGALPVALVLYILGTPGRKRLLREQELQERQQAEASAPGTQPDGGGLAATDAVAPVRKEP